MNCIRVSVLALLVITVFSSVTIRVGQTLTQTISQKQLSSYLSMLSGHNDESIQITPQLRKITSILRPSLLNPIDSLTVLLIVDSNIESISQGNAQLGNQFISFLTAYNKKIGFAVIGSSQEKTIQEQIGKYTGERSVVIIIRNNQTQISKLSQLIQAKGPSSTKRRLDQQEILITPQQATTDDFYLIKFFFSLLFIIVIIGIVVSIASNEGKKDTLLYAKFIADVNNGR